MAGTSEVLTTMVTCGKSSIGVYYGTNGDNLPTPSDVVKLYKKNGIDAMRLYIPNCEILDALKGSDIKVMMGVDNGMLKSLGEDPNVAVDWVQQNIVKYHPDVSFRYIVVGNEVPDGDFHYIRPALTNMWKAIDDAGFVGTINISTSVKYDIVVDNCTDFPSRAEFKNLCHMSPIINFLVETENPLFVNIYPYLIYAQNHSTIRLDYALFTAPGVVVDDKPYYQYQYLFNAMVDSVYYALEKARGSKVGVVVSESGWPSSGGVGATVENAQTYNQKLINHVVNGTPKKREHLETYICAIFNEDDKDGPAYGKKFGLFNPADQKPVYPIKFK